MTDTPPPLARHDPGCQCWPHVTEKDALEAIAGVGHLEYLDARRDIAAKDARIAALETLLLEIARLPLIFGDLSADVDWGDWNRLRNAARALLAPEPAP